MLTEIRDQVETIEQAEDFESLRKAGSEILSAYGFDQFTYHELSPSDTPATAFYISTYDPAWVRHYIDREYRHIDPVLNMARNAVVPFAWPSDQVMKRRTRYHHFFAEAADFGVKSGITIPVHGPGHRLSLLNGTVDQPRHQAMDHFNAYRHSLQIVAMTLRARVELLREPDISQITLSERQRECLLWTARGKTAWEIGEILSISERTVVFHLQTINRKFGVFSKHMSVVRAIMHGLIQP